MNIFKPSTWFKSKEEPVEVPEIAPVSISTPSLDSNDDVTFYERIRVMHVQQHPTSRYLPINQPLSPEEVYRRGRESWFMHQLGKDPTLEQIAYALSPQFAADKAARKENN